LNRQEIYPACGTTFQFKAQNKTATKILLHISVRYEAQTILSKQYSIKLHCRMQMILQF